MSGVFMTTYQTQDQALLQLSAPRHIRGRVMSFYLISRATVPIGTLFAGALAHYFGGPAAVQMMSLSALGLVLLVISTHPGFLRLKVDLEERRARLSTEKLSATGLAGPVNRGQGALSPDTRRGAYFKLQSSACNLKYSLIRPLKKLCFSGSFLAGTFDAPSDCSGASSLSVIRGERTSMPSADSLQVYREPRTFIYE